MCTVSMVHDFFKPAFEPFDGWQTGKLTVTPPPPMGTEELAELRQLIKDFREAIAAATRLDVLIKQPDCVDPSKAGLEARVAELERLLAQQRTHKLRNRKKASGGRRKATWGVSGGIAG